MEPMMEVFDRPIPFSTFGKRNVTNVPAQSLTLLNDPFVHDQAGKWAQRILEEESLDNEERVRHIYRKAYGRSPEMSELAAARELLAAIEAEYKNNAAISEEHFIWKEYCHTIFNTKEFIYLL